LVSRDMVEAPFFRVGFDSDAIFDERIHQFTQDFAGSTELAGLDAERFVSLGRDPQTQELGLGDFGCHFVRPVEKVTQL